MVDESQNVIWMLKGQNPKQKILKSCSVLKSSNKAPETGTIIIHGVEGRDTFLSEFSLAFISNQINEICAP